jgi:hypothetical protein
VSVLLTSLVNRAGSAGALSRALAGATAAMPKWRIDGDFEPEL